MVKTVLIGGNEYKMRASALIPRLYRFKFGRDIIRDLNKLQKTLEKAQKDENEGFDTLDLTIFENVAWLFCRHGDPENTPENPDEWLDSIEGVFSIYEVLPEILELWVDSNATTSAPAKK